MAVKNLLSISEFARFTGIPRSRLIYYDDIGLFSPTQRGKNNYRYYALHQIVTAKFVDDLTSFGMPLKTIIGLGKNRTPESIKELLSREIEEFQEKIRELREAQTLMQTMLDMIEEGLDANEDKISIIELTPYNLIIGPENMYQDAPSFYPAWISFLNYAKKEGYNLRFPVGGFFDTVERFFERPNSPQRFYFVNPNGKDKRESGKFLVGYTRGFYGEAGTLPERLKSYAKKHKLKLSGPVYNPFLFSELCVADPHDYLMRIAIKIVE